MRWGIRLDLNGKVALVCGGSKGIGLASAIELSRLGSQLIILSRSKENGEKALKSLHGRGHEFFELDLSDVNKTKDSLGRLTKKIDILVCNSGGPKSGLITEASSAEFLEAFQQHLIASHLLVQHVLPHMKKNKFGRIINIISTSVKAPLPNLGVSNTVRAAVAAWAKTLSVEVAEYGITVNNILPGLTDTERISDLCQKTAKLKNQTPAEVLASWIDAVPVKRMAEPQETGEAVAFLASPAASYINGINLPVDGGRLPTL